MKTFSIIGGGSSPYIFYNDKNIKEAKSAYNDWLNGRWDGTSPNAFLAAKDAKQAKSIYNDWLELTYGRRDENVSVIEIEPNEINIVQGGVLTMINSCVKIKKDSDTRVVYINKK